MNQRTSQSIIQLYHSTGKPVNQARLQSTNQRTDHPMDQTNNGPNKQINKQDQWTDQTAEKARTLNRPWQTKLEPTSKKNKQLTREDSNPPASIQKQLPNPQNFTLADYNDYKVFAIYQILLGWKTCKYYYETDELPNPSPTQPKKK